MNQFDTEIAKRQNKPSHYLFIREYCHLFYCLQYLLVPMRENFGRGSLSRQPLMTQHGLSIIQLFSFLNGSGYPNSAANRQSSTSSALVYIYCICFEPPMPVLRDQLRKISSVQANIISLFVTGKWNVSNAPPRKKL